MRPPTGAGVNDDDIPYLVTELMVRGSLATLLKDHAVPLTWDVRVRFAFDIAEGIAGESAAAQCATSAAAAVLGCCGARGIHPAPPPPPRRGGRAIRGSFSPLPSALPTLCLNAPPSP